MNEDFVKEAKQQYLHYFKGWFIGIGALAVALIVLSISQALKPETVRENTSAPKERVYDYAELLTDEEEQNLRNYIAEKEAEYHVDFVIYTFSQAVEGEEAKAQYGYRYTDWEKNMRDIADDFWDHSGYGYNKSFEGDGSILIDNRYPGQRGEWLSTSGKVEYKLSSVDVDDVLNAVDRYYDSNPYKAYMSYIDAVCSQLDGIHFGLPYYLFALIVPIFTALSYRSSHLVKVNARNTVAVNAYVAGGRPMMRNQGDELLRKHVTTRRIETTSSSSGGGGGGGGHHVSSSGASHGGGGHRH